MIFSIVNRNNTNSKNNRNNTNNTLFLNFNLNNVRPPPSSQKKELISNNENIQSIKKMKWGEPTWFLFHTLAHKLKPEYTRIIIKSLLQTFYTICINLPCPTCASHAKDYLNAINFDYIQSKEQLINLFFVFHNKINQQKSYPIFTKQQLDEKYETANTINIIHNFIYYYNDTSFNINLISAKVYRNNLIVLLNKWFNENIQYFNL
jgi:hypothetical protein